MAAQETHFALFLAGDTQQGIGQVLFGKGLQFFAASLVGQQKLAIQCYTQLANPLGFCIRIDELQFHVGFITLVAGDQVLNMLTNQRILGRECGNVNGIRHLVK